MQCSSCNQKGNVDEIWYRSFNALWSSRHTQPDRPRGWSAKRKPFTVCYWSCYLWLVFRKSSRQSLRHEFREALAKKAQDLKTKRALKSANKNCPQKVSEKNCIQAKMFQEANLEFSDVMFLLSNRFWFFVLCLFLFKQKPKTSSYWEV